MDRIRQIESGGNPFAKNPRSSAYGPDQFIESTWIDMINRYRPDLAGLPRSQLLGMRSDSALSGDMRDKYNAENQAKLTAAGFPATPGNTYLSYFAGPQGALSVLGANTQTPVSSLLGQSAVRANPFLQGMTAGDLQKWAETKMAGGSLASFAPKGNVQAQPVQADPPPTQGGGMLADAMKLGQGLLGTYQQAMAAPGAISAPPPGLLAAAPPPRRSQPFDLERFMGLLSGRTA